MPQQRQTLHSQSPHHEVRLTNVPTDLAGPTLSTAFAVSQAGGRRLADDVDDATQEASRLQWLKYYMENGDWARAGELACTEDERAKIRELTDAASHQ